MSVIVQLGEFKSRDTVAALRELLIRASRGEVKALAFNVEMSDGAQKMGFTGKYRSDPALGVKVANRMSQRLNEIKDAQEAATIVFKR